MIPTASLCRMLLNLYGQQTIKTIRLEQKYKGVIKFARHQTLQLTSYVNQKQKHIADPTGYRTLEIY